MKKKTPNKPVTLRDVAQAAGVSLQAVSLVVNERAGVGEETRAKIKQIIAKLGYAPSSSAQALRGNSTKTLVVIYPGTPLGRLPASGYLEEVLNGICVAANAHGYYVLLHALASGDLLDIERQRRADAVITVVSDLDVPQLSALERMNLPVISVQRPTPSAITVRADNRAGTRLAVEFLVRRGHSKIAYFGGDLNTYAGRERFEGYCDGLRGAGIHVDSHLVHHYVSNAEVSMMMREPNVPPELTDVLEVALGLLSRKERPTGVVCFSDLRAVATIRAARTLGLRVPEDVSVIGFNNFTLAAMVDPPLTTVHFPAFEIGKTAAQTAISAALGTLEHRDEVVLPVSLVIRSSSGACPMAEQKEKNETRW
ncbi:MAG: LacI family DNA-binding transcriptional regulator [Deinococcales bacterium]